MKKLIALAIWSALVFAGAALADHKDRDHDDRGLGRPPIVVAPCPPPSPLVPCPAERPCAPCPAVEQPPLEVPCPPVEFPRYVQCRRRADGSLRCPGPGAVRRVFVPEVQ